MRDKSSRREFVKQSAKIVAGAVILPNIIPASVLGKGRKYSTQRPDCYRCNRNRIAGYEQYEGFSGAEKCSTVRCSM